MNEVFCSFNDARKAVNYLNIIAEVSIFFFLIFSINFAICVLIIRSKKIVKIP